MSAVNRKNECVRCVAYVPGEIGHLGWVSFMITLYNFYKVFHCYVSKFRNHNEIYKTTNFVWISVKSKRIGFYSSNLLNHTSTFCLSRYSPMLPFLKEITLPIAVLIDLSDFCLEKSYIDKIVMNTVILSFTPQLTFELACLLGDFL